MNILLLMAGPSKAFQESGYFYPKNLTEITGVPMMQHMIGMIKPLMKGSRLLAVVQKAENTTFFTGLAIQRLVPGAVIIEVGGATGGALCSALLAIEHINSDEPLLICDGDKVVDKPLKPLIEGFRRRKLDGGIIVFPAVHPRWAYVKVDKEGHVIETAEKRPISQSAAAGLYYFARGRDFIEAAFDMMRKEDCVKGCYYICPSYNQMILRQKKVGIANVPQTSVFSLASPQGVEAYEAHLRHPGRRGKRR
jgi:dTDP-glucose pyrophosphorylase